MNTRTPFGVISQAPADGGISALDAHGLAGITYRQLDHWARQGWVTPSVDPGRGRSGRRLYSVGDVIRLALLRHLALSKVNTASAGPACAELEVPDEDRLILWGPIPGSPPDEPSFEVLPPKAALERLELGGAWVLFNPSPVRRLAAKHLQLADQDDLLEKKGAGAR